MVYLLRAKVNRLYWSEANKKMMEKEVATVYPTRAAAQTRIDLFAELDEDQQYRWTIEEAE